MRRIRAAATVVPDVSKTFLDTLGVAWCSRFAFRLVWVLCVRLITIDIIQLALVRRIT